MLLLLLHCNLVCASLLILEKQGNIMLVLLAFLSLPLQPPEASSTDAPSISVPVFAPGAQEGCNFQIKHNGNHQENVNNITPAMPRTVLAGFWDQYIALGKPAVCWADVMDCETRAACWGSPVSHEGVSMEPGMIKCQSITAILVHLKAVVPSCIFYPMWHRQKKKKNHIESKIEQLKQGQGVSSTENNIWRTEMCNPCVIPYSYTSSFLNKNQQDTPELTMGDYLDRGKKQKAKIQIALLTAPNGWPVVNWTLWPQLHWPNEQWGQLHPALLPALIWPSPTHGEPVFPALPSVPRTLHPTGCLGRGHLLTRRPCCCWVTLGTAGSMADLCIALTLLLPFDGHWEEGGREWGKDLLLDASNMGKINKWPSKKMILMWFLLLLHSSVSMLCGRTSQNGRCGEERRCTLQRNTRKENTETCSFLVSESPS